MTLNTTPSVYTNKVVVLGDSSYQCSWIQPKKRIKVMINGVPRMIWRTDGSIGVIGTGGSRSILFSYREVYQKVNLPAPSIGGTMNIITDPAVK